MAFLSRCTLVLMCCALVGRACAFTITASPFVLVSSRQHGNTALPLRSQRRSAGHISCNLQLPGEGCTSRRAVLLGSPAAAVAAAAALNVACPPQVADAANKIPVWSLDSGAKMPTLALNTAGLSVDGTERALRLALSSGITHVDFHPGIERDGVARVIRSTGRSGLFLTTKIRKAAPGTAPAAAADKARLQIEEDLRVLGVESVDMLMLRDSPDCDVMQAQWAVLEQALKAGNTRSIGVVNFCESALRCLLETATTRPALNYIMLHVGMGPDAHGLRSFASERGIRTFAYGALGEPGPSTELLSNPTLQRIASAHKRSPEEVAVRWALQSGVAVSVRASAEFGPEGSVCEEGPRCVSGVRMRAQLFDWGLEDVEMRELDAVSSPDSIPTPFASAGCLPRP
eukprot:2075437-Rhodomonas_salina.3